MLVLTRKTEQAIHLGTDVIIKVLKVSDGQVRIGIIAPKSLTILRDELVTRDNQEGKHDK
jgi:carbon storage regulator